MQKAVVVLPVGVDMRMLDAARLEQRLGIVSRKNASIAVEYQIATRSQAGTRHTIPLAAASHTNFLEKFKRHRRHGRYSPRTPRVTERLN
jgi:hypothetical protein